MSKVVVFGNDADVHDLGSNFIHKETNIHEDGKLSDEGKSSVHERHVPRRVSFDANNSVHQESRGNSSSKPLISRKSSGAQIILQTQTSMRNFQHSLEEYSGSPKASPQNNASYTKLSARKRSQGGVADQIAGHEKLHRQKSVMGPKTAFEMQQVNDELAEGMTCIGKYSFTLILKYRPLVL